MDLIIHSYGYSELIFHMLQGIAMFRQSGFFGVIVNTMVLLVGLYYALQMSVARAEGHWRQYLLKTIGVIVFVNSLLLPKASMLVKDHVEKSIWKVDNIPLAFALPVGMVESFGHILTMGFEQVFSLVGSRSSLMYYHYGTVFGARLSREVLQAKIRDPEVVGNMRNFIKRCVVLPSSIGFKYTMEELASTKDIWGLVSKNAGEISRTDMTVGGRRISPSPTCKEAVKYFESKFEDQGKTLINQLSAKFRGAGDTAKYNGGLRQLNKSITVAITGLYGGEHKVDSILKNNMMINSLNAYRSGKYASARAQMHQEASGMLSSDMAEKTLTGSLALMKVLVYGSFILLLPLFILGGGLNKYKSWIIVAFSLALWPPIFSMLNMVIDFAYEPAKIVSYSSWSTESKKFDSIASLAASLTLSTPFLAYYMTKLGEGGLSQIVGSVIAASTGAVSAIAGERASGTRSWDNESINNASRSNSSSFKTNHNMEYASGEQAWNNYDGARVRTTTAGQQIITGGAGITSDVGETRYTLEQSRIGQANDGAQRSEERLAADTRNLSFSTSNTFSQTKDWLKNIAKREAAGETINYEAMGEQGRNVQEVISSTKVLSKDHGYSWDQAAEAALTGSASGGTPGKDLIGWGVSVGVDGKISARNYSNQQFSEREQTDRNNQLVENYNNVIKAANNLSYSQDNSIDRSLSSRVVASYEEQERLEQAVSKSRHESEAWHQAQNVINSSGGSSSKDMTKEVIDRYMQETGISDRSLAHRHVSDRSPEVMKVWNKMLGEDHYVKDLVASIHSTRSDVSATGARRELDDFSQSNQIESGAYDYRVEKAATSAGFKSSEITNNIVSQGFDLSAKYSMVHGANTERHIETRSDVTDQGEWLQTKVDKFEEDRLEKGRMGRKILEKISWGGAMANLEVGGGPKESRYLDDPVTTEETSWADAIANLTVGGMPKEIFSNRSMVEVFDNPDYLSSDDIVKPFTGGIHAVEKP